MYKNVLTSQFCCSSPQKPYISYNELLSLYYYGYFKLTNMLRRAKNTVKMFFITNKQFSLFAWVIFLNLCFKLNIIYKILYVYLK